MADTQMIEQLEAQQSMSVQTAQGMRSDGKTLTTWPRMTASAYDNSFQEDPPNGVLAFLEPGDHVPEDAVVVIERPRLQNDQLSYSIQTLEGTVPAQAGPVTLFIDPFARWVLA